MNLRTIDISRINIKNINIDQVREEFMKRATGAKTRIEKAVKKAQKDVSQYQHQFESKIKDLSKIGKHQMDEAITFVKSQPITNKVMERAQPIIDRAQPFIEKVEEKVEPLKNDLKSKEKVIKNIVGNILKRAKDVRKTLKDPIARVQNLKNKVLKTQAAAPTNKTKKPNVALKKTSTKKVSTTKKRKKK